MAMIGEASLLSGINIETIRFYEREGIVPAPDRSSGGRRVYTADQIAILIFVKRCRDLGFPLADVRTLLALRTAADDHCDDVRLISERHIEDVRRRIADLRRLEKALVALVAECRKGRTDCPALRELFSR
ncbi:MAG TPA: MerR family DNA-binding protein [Kiloniellales bacterium]|jgi:MerR family mercuric resistance operon transcriptional regulator